MDIRKGQRVALDDVVSNSQQFQIELCVSGIAVDFSCFGIDVQGKLSNDAYMTFFNQPKTPCGAIELALTQADKASFSCQLSKLPVTIDRLVFTIAADGSGTMRAIQSGHLQFISSGQKTAQFDFTGQDFQDEKALMLGELYRKDGRWRFSAIGQGFNGGLAALVTYFGGEVAEEHVAPPTQKLSLEKRLEVAAPKLVNLAKKATVSLEKHCLQETIARICLVLDASGSMYVQYNTGKVQAMIDRLLPLAVHFDDNGELDVFAFSTKVLELPAATLNNYANFIDTAERGWKKWGMMSTNNEPAVIQKVIDYYKGTSLPVFVIFISDGGVSQNTAIKNLLTSASSLPIFWQFIGIGGRNYGVLEKMDTMTGRVVDNCGFFALDDLNSVSEQELYDRLLSEFPLWIKEAKNKHIV